MEALVLKDYYRNNSYDPNSPYSASKRAQITLLGLWRNGLPYVLMLFRRDPFQKTNSTHKLLYSNKPLVVYGDGKYTRDWLFLKIMGSY
jgi:dTDP-glucose 4,6-dehydratase